MAAATAYTAVGVFVSRDQAQKAIDELQQAGFGPEQIGVAVREEGVAEGRPAKSDLGTKVEEGAAAGAATGGALGALTGAVVTGLIPGIGPVVAVGILTAILGATTLGAAAGGLIGALLGMGIAEAEAEYYDREFTSGRVIVAVRAGDRALAAAEILRRAGAYRTSASRWKSQDAARPGSPQPPAGK